MRSEGRLVDLSQPVNDLASLSLDANDRVPQLTFQQGNAEGGTTVAARLDNLALDLATHVDLAGSLAEDGGTDSLKTVGEYPLEQFAGAAAVIDVSSMLSAIIPFFDQHGKLALPARDPERCLAFLKALRELEVSWSRIAQSLRKMRTSLAELSGILFYTGLARYWTNQQFQPGEYLYFFNPFPSREACSRMTAGGIRFVGIDALQINDPILNLSGQEAPFVTIPVCRASIKIRQRLLRRESALSIVLRGGAVCYCNLKIPPALAGEVISFYGAPWNLRLKRATTNSPVRPFTVI